MAATSSDGLDWQMSNGGYPVMYPGGQWDRVKCDGRHGITSLVLSCTAAGLYTCLGPLAASSSCILLAGSIIIATIAVTAATTAVTTATAITIVTAPTLIPL